MRRLFTRFLLPALLFAAGIYFLLVAPGSRTVLAYFMSAMFLGMGIAATQRAWGNDDEQR